MESRVKDIVDLAEEIRRKALRLFDEVSNVLKVVAGSLDSTLDAETRDLLASKTLAQVNRMIVNASMIIREAEDILKDLEKLEHLGRDKGKSGLQG